MHDNELICIDIHLWERYLHCAVYRIHCVALCFSRGFLKVVLAEMAVKVEKEENTKISC